MKTKPFKKLSRRTGFFFGERTTLYSTQDYFLLEKKIAYSAQYRRFFYDDIHSIITYQRPLWKTKILIINLISVVFSLTIFGLFLIKNISPFFLFFILPFWLYLSVELFLGPTCKTWIRTKTSSDESIFVDRYRKSKKVMSKMNRLIESRQGKGNE